MNGPRTRVLVELAQGAGEAGVREVLSALRRALEESGLAEQVEIVQTPALSGSDRGVAVAVYPEGVHYRVTPQDVPRLVEEHLKGGRPVEELRASPPEEPGPSLRLGRQVRVVLGNCGLINPEEIDDYLAAGGYQALERALAELSPQEVVEEVKRAKLRGRGGAGFPAGIKWEAVLRAPGPEKYVVCNADEGEPGTFKDRLILEGDPHKLIEGLVLAGYATGARRGFIYVRGEYTLSIARLERAISQARQYGLLGDDILGSGFSFQLEVLPGAGAYVCGEETSLLESAEGKRGWPRIRPPFPASRGLWEKPTVVNNVETLANVPEIILRGADWFLSLGTEGCPGTKVLPILGQVKFPGVVEVEMGIPLRTVIYELGGGLLPGRQLKGVLVGGAAGAFLSPQELDVRLDFDSLREIGATLGSGAVLVLDDTTCLVDVLASVLSFFHHESCGQCTPCRAGTDVLVRLVEQVRRGEGDERTLKLMLETAEVMNLASLCPLGQSVALPVTSALSRFRAEFEAHLAGAPCPRCQEGGR